MGLGVGVGAGAGEGAGAGAGAGAGVGAGAGAGCGDGLAHAVNNTITKMENNPNTNSFFFIYTASVLNLISAELVLHFAPPLATTSSTKLLD